MAKKRKLEPKSQSQPTTTTTTTPKPEPGISQPEPESQTQTQTLDPKPEPIQPKQEQPSSDSGSDSDSGSGSDSDESVQTLLAPFTKDQLIDLISFAAESHSDVRKRVKTLADADPVHRKIFVHGLGWDTTADTLTSVFSQFGEIEDLKHVFDKGTGKSKGYAFILFKHRAGARHALKEPQKKIGSRMAACQLASTGPVGGQSSAQALPAVPAGPPVSEYTQRKIFVSNVSADVDPQKLLGFFSKYGEIVEGPLGLDKNTGKPKGFTLFVYKTVESAKKALEEPHKSFDGHILHCQKAVDGPKVGKMTSYQPPSSGFVRNGGGGFGGGVEMGGGQPAMVSPAPVAYNQPAVAPQLNPVIGQALTALLATQGGLGNLLGAGVSASVPPVVNNAGYGMQGGYGNQGMGGGHGVYGNQGMGSSSVHQNYQLGQNNAGRSQQGGGHMGGVKPYMGR